MGKSLLTLLMLLTVTDARAFCFEEAGARYGVAPGILWAIAKAESGLDPSAFNRNRNGTIDVGLMQINSLWAPELGKTWKYQADPCTSVMTGAWVLSRCVRAYGYSWKAVGCYHSRTPEKNRRYAARIASILRGREPIAHDSR